MRVKTHLIVTDQYDEYKVKWHKRLLDSNPKLTMVCQFLFLFVIVAVEWNSILLTCLILKRQQKSLLSKRQGVYHNR